MKLYVIPGSPGCRKVVATAEFLDLKLDIVPVNPRNGDTKTPQFLEMNPNGLVPTLQDGSTHMWESNAIMMYLCTKKPGQNLFPDNKMEQVEIMRWMFWDQAHLSRASHTMLMEAYFKPNFMGMDGDTAKLEAATKDFERFGAVLDQHLKNKIFMCGDKITLADLAIAAPFMYQDAAKFPMQSFSAIRQWWGRLQETPAWVRSEPKF